MRCASVVGHGACHRATVGQRPVPECRRQFTDLHHQVGVAAGRRAVLERQVVLEPDTHVPTQGGCRCCAAVLAAPNAHTIHGASCDNSSRKGSSPRRVRCLAGAVAARDEQQRQGAAPGSPTFAQRLEVAALRHPSTGDELRDDAGISQTQAKNSAAADSLAAIGRLSTSSRIASDTQSGLSSRTSAICAGARNFPAASVVTWISRRRRRHLPASMCAGRYRHPAVGAVRIAHMQVQHRRPRSHRPPLCARSAARISAGRGGQPGSCRRRSVPLQ